MKKGTWSPKKALPEELHNVALVVKEFGEISKAASNSFFSLIFNMFFWVSGFGIGYSIDDKVREKVLESTISFCAIVIGFVITAMLFSGRNQSADRLSILQARSYAIKTKYILLSQTQTLIAFLFCSSFCVFSVMLGEGSGIFDTTIVFSMAMGFFCLGIYRTVFLPFQIFDVHSFALDSLLKEKDEQMRNASNKVIDGFKQKSD